MVGQIYPAKLQLNNVNSSDPLFGIGLVKWHIVLSDKRYDFNLEKADVSRATSYGVYISQLFRAWVCSNICDFHNINMTAKILKQNYHYH